MLRGILALGLSVVLLGGIAGCDGPGAASTTRVEDRPVDLRVDSGAPNVGPDGTELPPGVVDNE